MLGPPDCDNPEPIRQYLDELKVTIITMYQGRDPTHRIVIKKAAVNRPQRRATKERERPQISKQETVHG